MIRAAAVQFNHKAGDKAYNLERIRKFCKEAHQQGVQLISFPEMCITGYWHVRNLSRDEVSQLAEPVPDGPSVKELVEMAKTYQMIIGAGLIEIDSDGTLYNSFVVCDVDGTVHNHRKIHCFISEHMESGQDYTVFDSSLGHKIGVLICYDNNIIENARATALQGADILLAPHQTGGTDSRSPFAMGKIEADLWHRRHEEPEVIEGEFKGDKGRGWLMRWLPARAHDNGMFLVFSNGVGIDDDEVRTGNAMLIDCYGRIIAETWKAADDMVVGDLDMSLLERSTGRRWIKGRKPHLYDSLSKVSGEEVDPRTARFK